MTVSRSPYTWGASLFCVSLLTVSMPALAQSSAPEPVAGTVESDVAGTVENDIVVTARRREESAQSVPIAITALSEDTLKSRQVFDAKGLEAVVPSLNINSGNSREGGRYTLRGQGVTFGAGESVAVYFAEAPVPQYIAGGPGFFYDLANVQVLNGPQGTLFGKNTTGGAVLFTPRMPTDQFEGYVEGAYGNYDNRELNGAVNLPIAGDRVKLRVSGVWRKRDGFTRNIVLNKDVDNLNYWSARAILSVELTDNLRNDTIYSYIHSTSHGTSFIIDGINPTGPVSFFPAFLATASADLALRQQNGVRVTTPDADPYYRVRAHTLVNTTVLEAGELTFKNIFSFFKTRLANGFDIDGTRAPLVTYQDRPDSAQPSAIGLSNHHYYADELQVQGDMKNFDWVAGAFYSRVEPAGVARTYITQFGAQSIGETADSETTRALFAQGTLDLGALTPALATIKLTAGFRYTWDSRSSDTSSHLVATGLCTGTGPSGNTGLPATFFPNCTQSYRKDFSAGTYTLGADWQITPDTLVYATSRRGYKAGGFNTSLLPSQPLSAFSPEKVTDYEVGLKTTQRLGQARLRFNIAAFHNNYTDIQRTQTVAVVGVSPPRTANVTVNAAAARIRGIETQVGLDLGNGISIDGYYSYLDAKYKDFILVSGASTFNLRGETLPYSPRHKFSINPSFTIPHRWGGEVVIRAGYSYQSSFRASDVNQPGNIVAARGIFNASIDWNKVAGRPFDLSFFVTNLTNEEYVSQPLTYYYSIGTIANAYGEPRMFGVRARYSFGG